MKRIMPSALRISCLLLTTLIWLSLAGCTTPTSSTQTSQTTTAPVQTTTMGSTTTAREWPSDPNLNAPGILPLCKETVSLTIGVPQSPVIEDWETNLQTLELEKDLNMDLSFELLPFDNNELIQKVELMVMAGGDELPDVILHNIGGLSNLVKYGEMDMFVSTNDYYEHLAYFTEESLDTLELVPMTKDEYLKYVTGYDGNIYGVARFFTSINNSYSPGRLMIFEPWLQQLGLDMPQSTDDFVNVLRAFKSDDPNQNGKADEIPLMAYNGTVMTNMLRPLMNPFVYTQAHYYININGKIEFAPVQDGWKDGLKYIKSLFDEELISPLSLTQDATQFNSVMTQEETVIGTIARVSASNLSQSDIRRLQYIILDPLEGPSGLKQTTYEPGVPSIGLVISKNCDTPEAAFMFGDYMCSNKMSTWTRYGREGHEWEVMATPGESEYASLGYKGDIKILSSVWGTLQNIWWTQIGPTIGDGSSVTVRIAVGDTEGVYSHTVPIGRTIISSIEHANPNPILGLIFNEEEQEIVDEYMSTIEGYVSESFAQFVTGASDIDSRWDSYVAEFNKMGLAEYMTVVQSAFDRMNK